MDPALNWPMNLDFDSMGAPGSPSQQQNGQQQGNSNAANPAGVFMGATTPGGNANMM